eukprot:5947418-Prymnesium_polylepis.1
MPFRLAERNGVRWTRVNLGPFRVSTHDCRPAGGWHGGDGRCDVALPHERGVGHLRYPVCRSSHGPVPAARASSRRIACAHTSAGPMAFERCVRSKRSAVSKL